LKGEVITFGTQTKETYSIGCIVMYNRYANAIPIEFGGTEYKIISEEDVIIIEE
jgi:co-chaperonin GroES (HSP10)